MSDNQRSGTSTGRVSCKSTELKRCVIIGIILAVVVVVAIITIIILLLRAAYLRSPGSTAVKRLCVCVITST